MVCPFTGHRPERLPWGSDERDARCAALRTLIQRAVTQACADGFDAFLCGMARGCDMYFAEAVLAARETFPQIRLTAMIPCPTQPDAWRRGRRHGGCRPLCPAARQGACAPVVLTCAYFGIHRPCIVPPCAEEQTSPPITAFL